MLRYATQRDREQHDVTALDQRYEAIRAQGYIIDTRGFWPVLIHGQVAQRFEAKTQGQAFEYALSTAERRLGIN